MNSHDPLERIPPAEYQVLFLVLVLAAASLPHIANLPATIVGTFAAAGTWRLLAIRRKGLLPGKAILAILTVAGIGLVVTGIPLNDGRLVGTALLVVMSGLKLLELRSRRDLHVSVFLGFFIALTQFLYNQNLWPAIYQFLLCGLLLVLLISINGHRPGLRPATRSAGKQVLAALPLALALFVIFPRLDAPLWAINIHNPNALTGFSDRIRFGEIGRLSQSDALAFRVRFLNRPPSRNVLYWRGLVLWNFDGDTWTPGDPDSAPTQIEFDPDTQVDYEVTMEPNGQPWLFPLDIATAVPTGLAVSGDLQVRSAEPLNERSIHRFTSHTGHQVAGISSRQHHAGLQLPPGVGKRTRDLAQRWRRLHPANDQAVVEEALRFFNQEPFVYTLNPGTATGDPVENFLFERRRGFCEHYAGSFTLLMRLAGIPARIVVGYQGGERNPLDGHFAIHQYDAHAWSEVWLKDKGWTRIDPTAAVAPERVEQSIDIAESSNQGRVAFDIGDSGWLYSLVRNARWTLDAAELRWHRWVLGYSPDKQRSLLQSLGLARFGNYAPAVMLGVLLLVGLPVLFLLFGRRARDRGDPVQRDWQRYQARLRKAGLDVPHWLGPEQLLAKAASHWPAQEPRIRDITRHYVRLRYGTLHGAQHRRRLRKLVRQLRLD